MPLGDQLGILLVVFSPQFGCDSARLAYFLEQVPPRIEVAVEFRHDRWHTEEVFSLLERSLCGLLRSLRGAHLPCILRVTSSQSLCAPPRPRPQPQLLLRRLLLG
jgi:hypothetical protein